MSISNPSFSLKNAASTYWLILLLSMSFEAKSSHMAGAEISYSSEGNDSYKISYTLYTDCSGSLPPISVNLMIKSESCSINAMHPLALIPGSEIEISTNCSSSPSTCNGGTSSGFKQIKYSSSILLSEKCDDIIFSVTDCCRNSAITSIINPESQPLYVQAHLDNISEPNNSPVFESKPILVLNSNQSNLLSESALDTDGDSLVYTLIAPKTSEITNVNYASGYSTNHFVNTIVPIEFNTNNGTLKLIPSGIETAIFAIRVSEFRNGKCIGSTMRDIQVISTNSSNHLPSIQQLEALSSPIYKVCIGEELTINLSSVDLDSGQAAIINVSSNISDLVITKSTDQLQKSSIKWIANSASLMAGNLWIKVVVTDNACPMNGTRTYFLTIKVSELIVSASVTNSDCAGKNNGAIQTWISGNQAVDYKWSNSNMNLSYANGLSAGVYTVSIDNLNGCNVNRTFQINNLETISAEITTTSATCGGDNGKAEIIVSGGTQPYHYKWNDGNELQSRTNMNKGIYSVEVTDQIGCKQLKTVIIENENCNPKLAQFKLYPNPATHQITLQNDYLNTTIVYIVISDVSGKIVYKKDNEITDNLLTIIDVSDLSTGLYMVNIISIQETQVIPFFKLQ